ncbi:MAG: ATP-binding protein [Pseudomonadota bacterium]
MVVLAAMVIQAASVYRNLRNDEQDARDSVARVSYAGAQVVEGVLGRGELMLSLQAARPGTQRLKAAECPAWLQSVELPSSIFTEIIVFDLAGNRICSQATSSSSVDPLRLDAAWFKSALNEPGYALSDVQGVDRGEKPHVILSLPIKAEANAKVGLIVLVVDLYVMSALLEPRFEEGDRTVGLIDRNSVMLARYPLNRELVGKTIGGNSASVRARQPEGIALTRGVDGVERLSSSSNLKRYGLRLGAGVPLRDVYAESKSDAWENALLGVAGLLLAFCLAAWMARRLTRPLESLVHTVRDVARGANVRADGSLPGEFKVVAGEFNRMLDAQASHEEKLRMAEERSARSARLYQALSATNRSIVRASDAEALFEELTNLCVNFKVGHMAWIGLVQGTKLVPVTFAGRAREYCGDTVYDLSSASLDAALPAPTAVREGHIVVINDFVNDPRTAGWLDRARAFGVQSTAIVPFRRGGKVAGVLGIKADTPNYFDAALTALLLEMAIDLSFALDNMERERAREQAEVSVTRHERQLEGIIETAMDAIITVNSKHEVIVFNKAASRIFGMPASEAIGKPINHFLPARFHEAHVRHVAEFSATGSTSRVMGPTQSLVALRADGREFPIEASISRLASRGDVLMTVVLRDVTSVHEAREARLAHQAADAANRAKTEFLSRFSHELRTPLGAMMGFISLLQKSAFERLTSRELSQLRHIVSSGKQLQALVQDIDVPRIEAGNIAIEFSDIELGELLDSVVALYASAADDMGVSLRTAYRSEIPFVMYTDPVRLKQILSNLLSNAIKYNRSGGEVSLEVLQGEGVVSVVCRDTGIGMTEEQQTHLFQAFNRLGREQTSIEGSGIGLLLSRDLTALLGGTLDVVSVVGQGTQVTVTVPHLSHLLNMAVRRARSAAEAAARQPQFFSLPPAPGVESPAEPVAPLPGGLHGSVLYVEDSAVSALMVRQLLARWPDVKVRVAKDGKEGVILATDLLPDLVLLDMNLPDFGGVQVLQILRAETVTAGLKIVALSGDVNPAAMAQALALGADDYWTKPLQAEAFLANVSRFLKTEAEREQTLQET